MGKTKMSVMCCLTPYRPDARMRPLTPTDTTEHNEMEHNEEEP